VYDPNPDASRITSRDTNFGQSKTKRKIFEYKNERENTQPPIDIPGPGKYEPLNAGA